MIVAKSGVMKTLATPRTPKRAFANAFVSASALELKTRMPASMSFWPSSENLSAFGFGVAWVWSVDIEWGKREGQRRVVPPGCASRFLPVEWAGAWIADWIAASKCVVYHPAPHVHTPAPGMADPTTTLAPPSLRSGDGAQVPAGTATSPVVEPSRLAPPPVRPISQPSSPVAGTPARIESKGKVARISDQTKGIVDDAKTWVDLRIALDRKSVV